MTIAVWAVVLMLLGHWFSDFVWQPHWMGMRKSKEWWVLIQHALRITAGGLATAFVISLFFPISATGAFIWAAVNGLAHFGIDAVTSRITSRLFAQGKTHEFFTVIGFDQFLHLAFAVVTLAWLVL
jgi:hypothetical protein